MDGLVFWELLHAGAAVCDVLHMSAGGSGDRPTLSRRKSLQKSLRASFRRLRRRRSEPARPGVGRTKDSPLTHTG